MEDFYKYPRTYHLPWSLGSTSDDKFLENTNSFEGKTIVITEKMDGENTNMYPDRYHARSIDSKDHESRHYVKSIWGRIKHEIPDGWRICGENLYAKHSIFYDKLPDYFMVFSIWDENNDYIGWFETEEICKSLGLITVPFIDVCVYNEQYLRELASKIDIEHQEGYVISNFRPFNYNNFADNVAKYVREKHVTTDQHWMFEKVIPNKLKI
jgi:ATP-dependent RNA circularization protein (DNA/RNA ligase family)